MNKSYQAWLIWSIAIFVIWTVILLIIWKVKGSRVAKQLLLVFYGYCIGWISATIKFIVIMRKL